MLWKYNGIRTLCFTEDLYRLMDHKAVRSVEIPSGSVPDCLLAVLSSFTAVSFVRLTRLIQNINNRGTDDRRPAGSDRNKVEFYQWRRSSDSENSVFPSAVWCWGVIVWAFGALTEPSGDLCVSLLIQSFRKLCFTPYYPNTRFTWCCLCSAKLFSTFLVSFSSIGRQNHKWGLVNISVVSPGQQWANLISERDLSWTHYYSCSTFISYFY